MDIPAGLGCFKCEYGCLYCNHDSEVLEVMLAKGENVAEEFSEIMKEVFESKWERSTEDLHVSVVCLEEESLKGINSRKTTMGFLNDSREDLIREDYRFITVVIPAGSSFREHRCANTGFSWLFTESEVD